MADTAVLEAAALCMWVQVPPPAPPPRANVGGKMDVRLADQKLLYK